MTREASLSVQDPTYSLAMSDSAVWLQANRHFGNMVPGFSEDWQDNRDRAASIIAEHTNARQVIRMKPKSVSGFVDLDKQALQELVVTDGFVSHNPNVIMHANPADCGEIALVGFGMKVEAPVAALIHANRKIVSQGGHLQALEYLCESRGIDPSELTGFVGPSIRAESYKMPCLGEDFKDLDVWAPFIEQGEDGLWSIDLHGRTIAELESFGIPKDNLVISDVDTGSHPDYYSHVRASAGLQEPGANGLFFALR